jgi:hypothetical protein
VDGTEALIDEVLGDVPASPDWAWSDASVLERFDRVEALGRRVDAATLVLLRQIERRELHRSSGARSVTSWLQGAYRVSGGSAAKLTAAARGADDVVRPVLAAGLADGTVHLDQVPVIAGALDGLPVDQQTAGERFLVEQAAVLGPRELGVVGEHLFQTLDPEAAERRDADRLRRDEERAEQGRFLTLTDIPGTAQVRVTGRLDREAAAVIRAALDPLCNPPRPQAPHHRPRRHGSPHRRADDGAAARRRAHRRLPACPQHRRTPRERW